MGIKRGKTNSLGKGDPHEGRGGTLDGKGGIDGRGISKGRGIIKGREWTDDRWTEFSREEK
jgi:hypothetical protein